MQKKTKHVKNAPQKPILPIYDKTVVNDQGIMRDETELQQLKENLIKPPPRSHQADV